MLTFVIICPLLFLAGFVDAVAGGGGLISLPAYMLAGLSPLYAASFGIGTASGSCALCGISTLCLSVNARLDL